MPAVEHAVIAAAGLGSRLGLGLPKCLLSIDDRPLIHYVLELLADVPDVRIVVGYMEQDVIAAVRAVRNDAIFVRNPDFRNNTTKDSYAMGAAHLRGSCLFMDGDILFDPASFASFLEAAGGRDMLIGVTPAKTEHAVFVRTRQPAQGELEVTAFDRETRTSHEWANLAYLPGDMFGEPGGWVYSRLADFLPLPAREILAWEVDTQADLDRAESQFGVRAQRPQA